MFRMIKYVILLLLYYGAIPAFGQVPRNPETSESGGLDWEVFPIVSYDTDAGFGYGIKGYLRNLFDKNESYDVILYNSTKGERWYRFQFSYPDYEIRQGKDYGYAVDLTVDYDKWISYYFYGIGNYSSYVEKKIYSREPIDLSFVLNRTITSSFIFQIGIKYSRIKFVNFPEIMLPEDSDYDINTDNLALLISAVFDTRNSIINPTGGIYVSTGFEVSPHFSFIHTAFNKAALTLQSYHRVIFNDLIFAGRVSLQQLLGNNIPVQFLLPVGGNQSLRGYPQDRFLDKSSSLLNAEFRFPLWWRFGGIAGIDAGRVFSSLDKFTFDGWRVCPATGLRFYMDNFIVRADLGFSNETTGFYFNFGHIF